MEAPRKIVAAKLGGDKKLLSESGMVGARVRAEKRAAAQQEEKEMNELREEAFKQIAAERTVEKRLAEEKLEEERLRESGEDIIPLDTYE